MTNKFLLLAGLFFLHVNAYSQSWNLNGNTGTTSSNYLGTRDAAPLRIKTHNTLQMIIKADGSVGIGTSNPVSRLNVDGGSTIALSSGGYLVTGKAADFSMAFDPANIQGRYNGSASTVSINSLGGTVFLGSLSSSYYGGFAYGLSFGMYGYSQMGTGTYGLSNTGSGVFGYASTGGNDNSRGLSGVGNYGIYATTLNNTLYYAGYFAGDLITSGAYTFSDEKLKQNIEEFSNAINIISQLHPKTYRFRQDGNYKLMNLPQGKQYGLIAQDVERVLPGMVKNSKFDAGIAAKNLKTITDFRHPDTSAVNTESGEVIDFKALNYTEFIPLLIKGMQEQQQIIQNLQQTVASQQQQINLLLVTTSSSRTSNQNINGVTLQQNTPNPFSSNTVIHCTVPKGVQQAQLNLYDAAGTVIHTYPLTNKGLNEVNISGAALAAGNYNYALIIDGKKTGSKSMAVIK